MRKCNNNPEHYSFIIDAVYEQASKVNNQIASLLQKEGIDHRQINNINLIVEEIALNICKYAYPQNQPGPLEISIYLQNSSITLVFKDQGKPFNPLEHKAHQISNEDNLDDLIPGGLGIFLVRQIARQVNYSYKDNNNILSIRIDLDAETSA